MIWQPLFPSLSSQQYQTQDEVLHLTGGPKEMHDDPLQLWVSNLFYLLWPKKPVYRASLTPAFLADQKAEPVTNSKWPLKAIIVGSSLCTGGWRCGLTLFSPVLMTECSSKKASTLSFNCGHLWCREGHYQREAEWKTDIKELTVSPINREVYSIRDRRNCMYTYAFRWAMKVNPSSVNLGSIVVVSAIILIITLYQANCSVLGTQRQDEHTSFNTPTF